MNVKQLAGLAGMIGPLYLGATLISLTRLEYDFMRSLGWHPLHAPTFDWPSGLALGPYGIWMSAAFLASGLMMFAFALALRFDLPPGIPSKIGPLLLACSGLAIMGLAFPTDPTIRSSPATWHGRLHDFSFVMLGLTLLPALFFLGAAFRNAARWHSLGLFSWLIVSLAIPAFILKGIAFYIFLLAVMTWSEVVALQLKRAL